MRDDWGDLLLIVSKTDFRGKRSMTKDKYNRNIEFKRNI